MVPLVWTIAGFLALLGLWCLWHALVGVRRPLGACRHCGYDCSALAAPTCPECGRPPRSRTHASRRRRPTHAPLGVVLQLPLLALIFPSITSRALTYLLPARTAPLERTVGQVTLTFQSAYRLPPWIDESLGEFRIVHEPPIPGDFLRVTGPNDFRFELAEYTIEFMDVPAVVVQGQGIRTFTLADVPIGDLDGDDAPDLLITSFSGGAHCCWTYTALRLGPSPSVSLQIKADNGAAFHRAGSDTIVATIDPTWNYWNACYACSFKPGVTLRLSKGTLALAADLQFSPLPSEADLATHQRHMHDALSQAYRIHAEKALVWTTRPPEDPFVPDPEFWRVPLELLYSGHEAESLALLRRAWPDDIPGRDAFLADFTKNFEASPWCSALRRAFGP